MKYIPHETWGDDDLSQIALSLRKLWHVLVRSMNQPLAARGIQRQQYWVLGALAEKPLRMSELALATQTSQASLTGIVDRLEEHGMVRRSRSGEDRRVVQVEITDQGRELLHEGHQLFVSRLDELVEPLEPAERAELLRLLRKLTATAHDPRCR